MVWGLIELELEATGGGGGASLASLRNRESETKEPSQRGIRQPNEEKETP